MKGEIEKNLYCSADSYEGDGVCGFCFMDTENDGDDRCLSICKNCHTKWTTPEWFKKEYGKDVPADFPVWLIIPEDKNDNFHDWTLMEYAEALQYEREAEEADYVPAIYIVCACTPFGKPDKDWRPE